MPMEPRIVITEALVPTGHVNEEGERRMVKVRRYQLAFGGKVICRDVNDRNLLAVLFFLYMLVTTYHPEVGLFCFALQMLASSWRFNLLNFFYHFVVPFLFHSAINTSLFLITALVFLFFLVLLLRRGYWL